VPEEPQDGAKIVPCENSKGQHLLGANQQIGQNGSRASYEGKFKLNLNQSSKSNSSTSASNFFISFGEINFS
jgi:hypothetical protein